MLAVLTVAISRSGMVEAQQHIRAIAYGVAAGGILLCHRIQSCGLRRASRGPSSNWRTQPRKWPAEIGMRACHRRGHDEVSVLARSFNHMTEQLASQRDRLVQSERVAAWRELARRLAHELKNPLFPLQLTVENLVRARQFAGSGVRRGLSREHGDPGHGDRES